ncbi:MAG: ABC transporter ATP-binding protein [Halarsenatibacteraceae bacterium]
MFSISDLRYQYPKNEEDTIKGIDFEIKTGEIFGLLGPSGVGKSTTQKILTRQLDDFRGEIKYQGKSITDYDKNFYQDIGVGFEIPVHFSRLTAEENLDFFKKLYKTNADTDQMLERLGLYPDKDRKVGEFSKGMKVRLNFIRALLNQPKMLFLDEPTNGLDPKNARIIKDMIAEFKEAGGTVLLTTHLMNDVEELCDQVAFMAAGKIVETNTPKNLKLEYGSRLLKVEYSDNDQVKEASFKLDDLGENQEFQQVIKNKKILTMHSQEMTLDNIFIKITGRQ